MRDGAWIDAVIPCVGFGDYLADTLPRLLPHVDDLVIVTAPDDMLTQAVCLRWGVRAVQTHAHLSNGRTMDRSALVNEGLRSVRCLDWIWVQDADIAVPPDAGRTVRAALTDPRCIYGCDRVDCPSWVTYQGWQTGQMECVDHAFLKQIPTGMRPSPRFADASRGGWLPIGFLQIWHAEVAKDYAWLPGCDCDATDLAHAARWPRDRRRFIPELLAVHLAAGKRDMGADWRGRVTPTWGPPPIPAPPPQPVGAPNAGRSAAGSWNGPPPADPPRPRRDPEPVD